MSDVLDRWNRLFEDLEKQRVGVLAKLEAWEPERVYFRPQPGAWCAVEVLDHIVRAETETLADVRVGLADARKLSPEHRPGIATLGRALRSEASFRIPAGASSICPDACATLEEVCWRWEVTRRDLGRMLAELDPGMEGCGVFCHPFAGWMTVDDLISHFSDHLFHHEFQIARLRAASDEPGS
jgi:hypothetical protein